MTSFLVLATRFCARVILHASRKLPRTDERQFVCSPENEGGGAPNGAPKSKVAAPGNSKVRAWPRSCKRIARLPALHRGHAPGTLHPQLGPGRASWNHRIQTGGPSPAPVQRAPRSPVTRRTGRCPSRLRAKSDELRPQEPHPLRQSASPVDVPHDERDGRLYSNNKHVVKAFLIYSNKSRGYAI